LEDPYLYPESGVLINRFGIQDAELLTQVEGAFTRLRARQRLERLPITPRGFQAVHKHLMGDIYAWAGQPRNIDMYLAGPGGRVAAEFEQADRIKTGLQRVFAELKADHYLAGASLDRFVGKAAHYIAELNRIHPFRDGNGRTMRFWLRELAAQAGHKLELKRIEPEPWIRASIAAHRLSRDYGPMVAVIKGAIAGLKQAKASDLHYGEVSIDDARLAVLRHLDAAIEQASARVAALGIVLQVAVGTELKGDQLKAIKTVNWLGSREDGPLQRLEILRAAGVQSISLPRLDGKSDLDCVMAIGKASQQVLKTLPDDDVAEARALVSVASAASDEEGPKQR
jgi:cell filamentation protein